MQRIRKSILIRIIILLLFAPGSPWLQQANSYCGTDVSVPPFLASGVTPNLLVIIDNSASMYDLAYVDETNQNYCFDDSYASGSGYAGYFEQGKWYVYNSTTDKFQSISDASAAVGLSAATYKSSDAFLIMSGASTVGAFAAKGNFLNWATASKLDIEKKVLTGGKYDAADTALLIESRGCLNRRMIKQITLDNGDYLTLGVRPHREEKYDSWTDNTAYSTGDIVSDLGDLYIAATSGTSNGTGVADDTGVIWAAYNLTRWKDGVSYPAGSIVTDPANFNTIDEGTSYITKNGGIANGTSISNDTGITDWETYNVTHIELFPVTGTGFDNSACQSAVEGFEDPAGAGTIKQDIEDCMNYGSGNVSNQNAAFNHSIHNCWYLAKQGTWAPGSGPVQSIKPACEAIYNDGIDPQSITPDDPGYICGGTYNADPALQDGYVGRCWMQGGAAVWGCIKFKKDGSCLKEGWVGGTGGSWVSDDCIEDALKDYCGILEIPQVIDPTDQADESSEFWNLPAVLIDTGITGQVGEPLVVMKGRILQNTTPEGLIQEFADSIRMGLMTFNIDGSNSECSQPDPYILYNCSDPANRDGGQVVAYIDQGAAHTDTLVTAMNDIKATSWTPLAEAMYTAIGYYTQNSSLRLDSQDFLMDATHPDPVIAWCQNNNVLIITEGASTADLNGSIVTFTQSEGQNDGDTENAAGCGTLSGSTLLDDLTHYANFPENELASPYPVGSQQMNDEDKQGIKTHIVVAGTLRSTGADECSPDVLLTDAADGGGTELYAATNPSALEDKLREAFSAIRAGSAAGSAASVISSSRGGEGAIYQAIFWPEVETDDETLPDLTWIGEVHGLFIDTYGDMYEDTNGNRTLDDTDIRVIIYYDEGAGITKACNGELDADGNCVGTSKDLQEVRYLWSAAERLASIPDTDILTNRTSAEYISTVNKRYIFTWNDINNDGIVASGEIYSLEERDWAAISVSGTRGPIPLDFGVQSSSEVNEVVKWIRGSDQTGMRSRKIEMDFDNDGTSTEITYRLGDVVHSTPVTIARPSESFHFLYNDASYAEFAAQYNNRRHVIYYGGNDGMLHAVNGGFYNTEENKFCLTPDCQSEASAPQLGTELWAFVPYNLLPHLKCLTNPGYEHKYYVDQRPRTFDVRIFPDDADHPEGWGTILVGSMRFGGTTVLPGTLDLDGNGTPEYPADTREFISAYFVFDVTNPEKPPVLLGEMTHSGIEADLGYSTVIPTVVPMVDGGTSNWYLVFGSGPTTLNGQSTQNAKVAVFPLSSLTGTPSAFRIPNTAPAGGAGSYTLAGNSFISDPITVDFDLEQDYKGDVVYFGTVEGSYLTSWSGKLHRMVTRNMSGGVQTTTTPQQWSINTLLDAGQPITASPTVGSDGENYWVYFGTGRFFDPADKSDNSQQSFYGIKEPLDCDGEFTWETVEIAGTPGSTPGSQGLVKVGQILVSQSTYAGGATISCSPDDPTCLSFLSPVPTTFEELIDYIAGSGCTLGDPTGTDGWYRDFHADRERNLGQATLLGGLLTYTSYQPFNDVCLPEGLANLYGLYFQTGTAWYEPTFGDNMVDGDGNIIAEISLGRGLATTPNLHVGKNEGSQAFVQTSTGAIVEIPQVNLPFRNTKTGRVNWIEDRQ